MVPWQTILNCTFSTTMYFIGLSLLETHTHQAYLTPSQNLRSKLECKWCSKTKSIYYKSYSELWPFQSSKYRKKIIRAAGYHENP